MGKEQQAKNIKLYILDCGSIYLPDKGHMSPGRGGNPVLFPAPVFLIEHPEGLVLIDTGNNFYGLTGIMKEKSKFAHEQRPDMVIKQLGYKIEDIKYVIMSHLHIDHTGWMKLFPKSTFIVRKEELKMAWWPDERGPLGGGYLFENYKDTRQFHYIELPDDIDYDVFGDGSVVCIDTKGHTRGHQSIMVTLSNTGKIVLAMDAASFEENYREQIPPGEGIWSEEWAQKAYVKFKGLEEEGAFILFGHDPDQWKTLKIAPQFYD
jgi:N-acyl homoserine lactone hydrolase